MDNKMGVPLEDILALPVLEQATFLAGHAGLGRLVTGVNVMEVPDIADWVSSGELLITTAHSIKDNIEVLTELIPWFYNAGVAGLGIKLKRYVDEIPESALEIAEQLSFPLFEIPAKVSFPEIISSVLTNIVNKQTNLLLEVQNLNKALTSIMLNGGDLQQIADLFFRRFGNSVAISSDYFSSRVISTSKDKRAKIISMLNKEKKRMKGAGHSAFQYRSYRVQKNPQDKCPYDRLIIPISSDNILYGDIFIWEDSREISSVELSLIESATSLIALDFVKKVSMLEIENRHKLSFFEDLLSGDKKRLNSALKNAAYFNFNPKAEHLVIIIRFQDMILKNTSAEKTMFRFNNIFSSILQRLTNETTMNFLSIIQYDNVILLCESLLEEDEVSEESLHEFLELLTAHLRHENLLDSMAIGVGRSSPNYTGIKQSMAEANRAVSCAGFIKSKVIYYSEMGIYRLLTHEALRTEVLSFYEQLLGPLLEYDDEKNSELVKTLSTYFKCKGNLTRLAEELNLHYNTAVYRMQRIRDLSGQNLDCSEDLLNLQIALKIHKMVSWY